MAHPLEIGARGDREIVVTRAFDGPRPTVFDAWTRPERLRRWLGVRGGWTMPVCEVDLRVGGSYRFVWEKDGAEMGVGGIYREVVAPERIVNTEAFDEPWYPGEGLVTLALAEDEGRTTCTMTLRYETREARDQVLASPMEGGLEEGFAALDELLAGSREARRD